MTDTQMLKVGHWYYLPEQDKLVKLDAKGQPAEVCQLDNLGQKVANYFIAHPGVLISKEQLLQDVWGIRDVSDGRITRVIRVLRSALGDDSRLPSYIETIPKRGYRFIAEVSPISELPAADSLIVTEAVTSGRLSRSAKSVSIALLAGTIALLAWWWLTPAEPLITEVPLRHYQPVTSLDGLEFYHNVSADEAFMVFSYSSHQNEQAAVLILQDLKTHQRTQLTEDGYRSFGAAFHPDGYQLAYQRFYEDGLCNIHLIKFATDRQQVLSDTKLVSCGNLKISARLSWSPDGRYLTYQSIEPGQTQVVLMLLPVNGGAPEQLTVPPVSSFGDFTARFSRNGEQIAFLRDAGGLAQLWVLDLATRSTRLLVNIPETYPGNIDWSLDNRSIIYSSAPMILSQVELNSQKVTDLARTNVSAFEVQLASSGNLYASTGLFSRINIRRQLNPRYHTESNGETVFSSNRNETFIEANPLVEGPVAVVSRRSGLPQIWLFYQDGRQVQLSQFTQSERIRAILFSPDGQQLLVQLNHQIWLFSLHKAPIQVAGFGDKVAISAGFSQDGQSFFYSESHQGRWQVVSAPLIDPLSTKIMAYDQDYYQQSYFGDYAVWRDSNTRLFYMQRHGSDEVELLPFRLPESQLLVKLDLRAQGIYFSKLQQNDHYQVFYLDLSTKQLQPLSTEILLLHSRFSLSADEQYLYYLEAVKADIDIGKIEGFIENM
ncbi:winged helix-turn-helix domain-containing protein [Arsukibacterium sp.]|uniref:winged helix-turn-helix domain-containing protein n=1 Tax=Arsukibacterium sp. TaxID=1977258 RepID=UPI002FDA6320